MSYITNFQNTGKLVQYNNHGRNKIWAQHLLSKNGAGEEKDLFVKNKNAVVMSDDFQLLDLCTHNRSRIILLY